MMDSSRRVDEIYTRTCHLVLSSPSGRNQQSTRSKQNGKTDFHCDSPVPAANRSISFSIYTVSCYALYIYIYIAHRFTRIFFPFLLLNLNSISFPSQFLTSFFIVTVLDGHATLGLSGLLYSFFF